MTAFRIFRCFLPAAFAIVFALDAFAQKTIADTLTELESAMRAELAEKKPATDVSGRSDRQREVGQMVLAQLRSAMGKSDNAAAVRDETLNQVLLAFESEAVRAAIEKVRVALREERQAKEKAFIAETQVILERARKAVQEAQTAADLDAAVRELANIREDGNHGSDESRRLVARVQRTRQFAIHWQDYLAQVAAGKPQLAKESLRSADNVSGADVLPRSDILARLAKFKEEEEKIRDDVQIAFRGIPEILQKIRTLDDLNAAIYSLAEQRRLSQSDRAEYPAAVLQNELIRISRSYQDFRAGRPTLLSMYVGIHQTPPEPDVIRMAFPVKLQLMRLLFPLYLRVKETPHADESLEKYADRMMQVAFERADARMLVRVCEMRHAVAGTFEPLIFTPAVDALLAAMNQDAAGQPLLAVISYQRALRAGGALISAEAIGSRLKAIKAAHPADYEAGVDRFIEKPDIPLSPMRDYRTPVTFEIPAPDPPPK